MRSFTIGAHSLISTLELLLQKKEEGPNRDPLVIYCHKPFKALWPMAYLIFCFAGWTLGGIVFFVLHFLLYHMSEKYHDATPNKKNWVNDQVAIAWYIIATHLPFVDEWWVWVADAILALSAIFVKKNEARAEPWKHRSDAWCWWGKIGSYYLLVLGIWSAAIIVAVGIPNQERGWLDTEAVALYTVIVLFLLEWVIYHKSINLTTLSHYSGLTNRVVRYGAHEYPRLLHRIERVFNKTELKHAFGGAGASLLCWLVITM